MNKELPTNRTEVDLRKNGQISYSKQIIISSSKTEEDLTQNVLNGQNGQHHVIFNNKIIENIDNQTNNKNTEINKTIKEGQNNNNINNIFLGNNQNNETNKQMKTCKIIYDSKLKAEGNQNKKLESTGNGTEQKKVTMTRQENTST